MAEIAIISGAAPGVYVEAVTTVGSLEFYPFGSAFMIGSSDFPAYGAPVANPIIIDGSAAPLPADGVIGDLFFFEDKLYAPKSSTGWLLTTQGYFDAAVTIVNVYFHTISPNISPPEGITGGAGKIILVPTTPGYDIYEWIGTDWVKQAGSFVVLPGIPKWQPPPTPGSPIVDQGDHVNYPVSVNSYSEFVTLFGNTSSSAPYVQAFFDAYSRGSLKFVRVGLDAGAITPLSFTKALDALETLYQAGVIDSGVISMAEAFATLNVQGRTAVGQKLEAFCGGLEKPWMGILDPGKPSEINTVTKAVAERKLYQSTMGDLAFNYPWCQILFQNFNFPVPPSPILAALYLRAWSGGKYGNVPAGYDYPFRGVTGLMDYVLESARGEANANGVNILRFIPRRAYLSYGARTMSAYEPLLHINSVASVKVIIQRLLDGLEPFVLKPVSGNINQINAVLSTIDSILFGAWNDGLLYGNFIIEENFPYIIRLVADEVIRPGKSVIKTSIGIVPAFAVERIEVGVNVTTPGQVLIVTEGVTVGGGQLVAA